MAKYDSFPDYNKELEDRAEEDGAGFQCNRQNHCTMDCDGCDFNGDCSMCENENTSACDTCPVAALEE